MNLKRILAMLTAAVMLSTMAAPGLAAETKDDIVSQITGTTMDYLVNNGGSSNIYSNIDEASHADALPVKFDLRDRGVVPPVRNQGDLGTCWSFASIGASEISILSSLGMTAEEFREKDGGELDLSERHLAWFSTTPIAETEGMSEHDLAQVGEGRTPLVDDGSANVHMGTGGFMGYASAMFASGIGPVYEDTVPYRANDGTSSLAADWSVDESLHFAYHWELKDSSILPSPAGHDAEGNYVYNPIATEMIKQELLNGRAVAIAYCADQAMSPEARANLYRDRLVAVGVPEEAIAIVISVLNGEVSKEDLTDEQMLLFMKAAIALQTGIQYDDISDEVITAAQEPAEPTEEELQAQAEAAAEAEAEAEAAARAAAERLGIDYDEMKRQAEEHEGEEEEEAEPVVYMNVDHYAQYVWAENIPANHAVIIVGYDDTYPASNFMEGHEPPADGAWIIRNSWGTNYGNDGYFYLSYSDKTIILPESFEYVTDSDSMSTTGLNIEEYDFMQSSAMNSCASQNPVYLANEFTMTEDSVLIYVSTMTANLNTNVTAAVYLLNEDAKSPVDGDLLDVRTVSCKYAGYHRIPLSQHYMLPAGTRISVVQTQRYNDDGSMHYALPYIIGTNCDLSATYNTMLQKTVMTEGMEGRMARGESFVGMDNEWFDWVDILDEVKSLDQRLQDFMSFDNHSIKLYSYFLTDINSQHTFGEPVPYAGGSIRLCTDCGYTLVEK